MKRYSYSPLGCKFASYPFIYVGGERNPEGKLFCPRTQHISGQGPGVGGGVLIGIFGGGVPPASLNPDQISDQNMPFPIPVFRSGLNNPHPFSDLTSSIASPQFLPLPLFLYFLLSLNKPLYCSIVTTDPMFDPWLSWKSTAPVSHRPLVKIPFKAEFLFRLQLYNCLSCV